MELGFLVSFFAGVLVALAVSYLIRRRARPDRRTAPADSTTGSGGGGGRTRQRERRPDIE